MLAYGLGTNSMILWGFAVSYGEIVIVIPDDIPADFATPTTPLTIYHQNTYDGITLYLNQEWVTFLSTIQADIHLVMKKYYVSTDEYFDVLGTFDPNLGTISFNLTVAETDLLPPGRLIRWSIVVNRDDPDFTRTIIKGNVRVEPTLRRVS